MSGTRGARQDVIDRRPSGFQDDAGHSLTLLELACGHHVLRRAGPAASREAANCRLCGSRRAPRSRIQPARER